MKYTITKLWKLMSLICILSSMAIAEENRLPEYLPNPPLPEKNIKDYSIHDVIGCICVDRNKLEADHPYRLAGINGIQKKWLKAKNYAELEKTITTVFKLFPEKTSQGQERVVLDHLRVIIRDVFVLTRAEKATAVLTVVKRQIKNPQLRYGVRLCILVSRDLLDVDLLVFVSKHFDEKEVESKMTNEDGNSIIFTYGGMYKWKASQVITDRFGVDIPLETRLDTELLKTWLNKNLVNLRNKGSELYDKGIKSEEKEGVEWLPRKRK